jgi:TolA-binding protein
MYEVDTDMYIHVSQAATTDDQPKRLTRDRMDDETISTIGESGSKRKRRGSNDVNAAGPPAKVNVQEDGSSMGSGFSSVSSKTRRTTETRLSQLTLTVQQIEEQQSHLQESLQNQMMDHQNILQATLNNSMVQNQQQMETFQHSMEQQLLSIASSLGQLNKGHSDPLPNDRIGTPPRITGQSGQAPPMVSIRKEGREKHG